MRSKNLFDDLPTNLPDELFTTLCEASGVRIERIVSQGHASPEGFWYDQPGGEWVIVLQGDAVLEFEGETEPTELRLGSYVHIPPRVKHRVVATNASEQTIWLAVHYDCK